MIKRTAILVIGMHRSGTSMVSGILKHNSFDLGKNLWQPDYYNTKGYFENSTIGIFNDKLFKILYVNWHDTPSLPDKWWLDTKIRQEQSKLEEIIKDEYNTSSNLLFKDPRISVLLPFYLEVFQKIDIKPHFVICFRDPFEVSASLKKRNNISKAKSLILWMDYNLKAEVYSRNHPRIFIYYDRILEDPLKYTERILQHFGFDSASVIEHKKQISEFADKKLKHHSAKNFSVDNTIFTNIKELYNLLITLNGKDTNAAINQKFNQIGYGFYPKIHFCQGVDEDKEAIIQIETTSLNREISKKTIQPGKNQLKFSFKCTEPITKIVLNPCNQRTAIKLVKACYVDNNNEQFDINPQYNNAEWVSPNGTMIFESEIPELTYILETPIIITDVFIDIEYLTYGSTTYRLSIAERNLYHKNLVRELENSQKDIRNYNLEIEGLNKKILKQEDEKELVIQSYQQEIDNLSISIAKMESEHNQAIVSLQQDIDGLSSLIAKIKEEHSHVITSKQHEIESLSTTIKRLKSEHDQVISSKQQDIENLTMLITNMKAENDMALKSKQQEINKLLYQIKNKEASFNLTVNNLNQRINQINESYKLDVYKLRKTLSEKEQHISNILRSYTWKTGKIILWPVYFIYKKLMY